MLLGGGAPKRSCCYGRMSRVQDAASPERMELPNSGLARFLESNGDLRRQSGHVPAVHTYYRQGFAAERNPQALKSVVGTGSRAASKNIDGSEGALRPSMNCKVRFRENHHSGNTLRTEMMKIVAKNCGARSLCSPQHEVADSARVVKHCAVAASHIGQQMCSQRYQAITCRLRGDLPRSRSMLCLSPIAVETSQKMPRWPRGFPQYVEEKVRDCPSKVHE